MINFNYETDFSLKNARRYLPEWIINMIYKEAYKLEEINYVFCDDAYLT